MLCYAMLCYAPFRDIDHVTVYTSIADERTLLLRALHVSYPELFSVIFFTLANLNDGGGGGAGPAAILGKASSGL